MLLIAAVGTAFNVLTMTQFWQIIEPITAKRRCYVSRHSRRYMDLSLNPCNTSNFIQYKVLAIISSLIGDHLFTIQVPCTKYINVYSGSRGIAPMKFKTFL